MLASDGLARGARNRSVGSTLAGVPQRAFGDTGWVMMALESCVEHLTPAIRSGKPHRVANAVRAIAHAPTPQQVDDVVSAACHTMLSEAYATHDARFISDVVAARSVVHAVVEELQERAQRDALEPAQLREAVNGYVSLVALVDKNAAQRLDAVGELAARIGYAMHRPSSILLDIELAGRLCGIGMLSKPSGMHAGAQHPVIGAEFLANVPSLSHLAPIVRSHQEWFDGHGGPDGLRGDEIPFSSRVISVAAAFVDLISGSPAEDAVPPNTACRKLAAAAGTRFDPRIVSATLTLLRFRQRTNRSA